MAATEGRAPRGSFQVNQRVLRGYGPLALFVVIMIVVALTVPSKPRTINNVSAGNDDSSLGTGSDTSVDPVTGEVVDGEAVAPGGGTSASGKPIDPPKLIAGQQTR